MRAFWQYDKINLNEAHSAMLQGIRLIDSSGREGIEEGGREGEVSPSQALAGPGTSPSLPQPKDSHAREVKKNL